MRALLLRLLAIAAALGPYAAAAGEPAQVANLPPGVALHMREAPDRAAKAVAYLREGAVGLEVVGPCGEWCPVTFKGLSGWAFRKYLAFASDAAAPDLPERSEPAESRTALTTAPEPGAREAAPSAPAADRSSVRYAIQGAAAGRPVAIRESASETAPILGGIPHDARDVEGLKPCEPRWCMVRYAGVTGWAERRHLASAGASAKRLRVVNLDIAASLPVKAFPADAAPEVGAIPSFAGGIVQIGECDKAWCHVRYLGVAGWVSARFVAAEAPGGG
ncbi:MAG: SH3 domain-containing protein [Hyphomicrobiales bacterium]|nr:SH3 domain-containing protein [Hyphomicrobiales bacterium]